MSPPCSGLNLMRLRHLWCNGCPGGAGMRILQGVLPTNRVLLAGQRTGLAEAGRLRRLAPAAMQASCCSCVRE